jgi:hypothetical protein
MKDEFDYINNAYGLHVVRGSRVRWIPTNILGSVAKGDGQYIHIRWDDSGKVKGPYHPTSELEYLIE